MRIHYIMHMDYETIGVIENWAKQHGHTLTGTLTYRGESLPSIDSFDMLIILGGPQDGKKIQQYNYLMEEIIFIQHVIALNKGILGFCLGAQLIGQALGAPIQASPEKEIGIYPVTLTREGQQDPIFQDLPASFNVIHWHNDMPGLAQGAIHLASSAGCPIQAFKYGDRIYGLQFHMEISRDSLIDMIEHSPTEFTENRYIEKPEVLRSYDLTDIHQDMYKFLNRFTAILEEAPRKACA